MRPGPPAGVHAPRLVICAMTVMLRCRGAPTATAAGASIETRANTRWRLRVGTPQSHPASQRFGPHAAFDGIAIACVALESVAIAVAGVICLTRSRLNRTRDEEWENDIRELLDSSGRICD